MAALGKAVMLRTDRGGKDPDTYYVGLTLDAWEGLPQSDPWRDLGNLIDDADPGVLTPICSTRKQATEALRSKGYRPVQTEYAEGY